MNHRAARGNAPTSHHPTVAGALSNALAWTRATVACRLSPDGSDAALNRRLRGYPRNHDYLLHRGRPIPSPRLCARWMRIASLYPEHLTSLLDVGSCKGYFVLDAAARPTCRAAVGIDVHEPFVSAAAEVAARTNRPDARFHTAPLDRFAADPDLNTGPYQVVLLLNTYHYLFAGSELSPLAFHGHRPILSLLAGLCSDRVIFSSPLDLHDCPTQVRHRAQSLDIATDYSRDHFLHAAAEFFDIEDRGHWGRRPLLVLYRRRPLH